MEHEGIYDCQLVSPRQTNGVHYQSGVGVRMQVEPLNRYVSANK